MSSVLKTFASNIDLPLDGGVITIGFNGFPIQFSLENGVLDFIFANGFIVTSDINKSTTFYIRGSNYSAVRMVDTIGPNFISWLEINEGADVGSVTVFEKPIVVRANLLLAKREPNNDMAMFVSTSQISFEQSAGNAANNYYTTFLFKKPLVLKYTVSGVTEYRAFTTQFTGQV
jgi:hypothetical protein